jgi:hypothetical protein
MADEIVPLTISERQRWRLSRIRPWWRLEGTHHLDLIDPESAVWPEIALAIRRALGLS